MTNQAFIVHMKSTLVLYRKGLCVFWFWDLPWKKSYVGQSVASISDQTEYHLQKLGFPGPPTEHQPAPQEKPWLE